MHRLEVAHFAGVRSAEVDFGDGLNVLFGPNELGKSSLVHAIRAALLLQDSAREHAAFVDWHADKPPEVKLTFQTEPQRIYRVHKTFGSGSDGSSWLSHSKDGVTFAEEARGREVEGVVRGLLRWGIEAPGGRRGPKGIGRSFLSTALIGTQAEVDAVLGVSLDDDTDESGKRRLTEALQRIAEDPRFRRVLRDVQSKVSEAYTATGRRRSGKTSPWVEVRDDRKRQQNRRSELQSALAESESAEVRIQKCNDELLDKRGQLEDARQRQKQIHAAWESHRARQAALDAVREAGATVAKFRELASAVEATRNDLNAVRADIASHELELSNAKSAATVAANQLDQARDRIRALESDDAESKRRLREEELKSAIQSLETREVKARNELERAQRVEQLEAKWRERTQEVEAAEAESTQAHALLDRARKKADDDRHRLTDLERQILVQAVADAERLGRDVDRAAEAAAEARRVAESKREEARALRSKADGSAPPSSVIDELRALATDLRVAEEKLEVGLAVEVSADGPTRIEVSVDEGAAEGFDVSSADSAAFHATARMAVTTADGTRISIAGGRNELRADAERLRAQWRQASTPVFSQAGVADLDGLGRARKDADELLQKAQALEQEAATVVAGTTAEDDLEGQKQRAQEGFTAALANLDRVVGADESLEVVRARYSGVEPGAQAELRRLTTSLDELREQISKLDSHVARSDGGLETKRRDLASLAEQIDDAKGTFAEPWSERKLAAQRELELVAGEREAKQAALAELKSQTNSEVDEARARFADLERSKVAADRKIEDARQLLETERGRASKLEGELEIRVATAEANDLVAAEAEVQVRREALEALPVPELEVSEAQLAQADRDLQLAEDEVRKLEVERGKADGALQQVGGQRVREQLEQVEDALRTISSREHEMELQYEGWKLLRETLEEAEKESVAHLGNALIEPVAKRMAALTGERYGAPAIGPKLKTTGIERSGSRRDVERLSVGTRDQLATLIRLSIAEAIGSVLVLDDHLTQSDPARMVWLRDTIRDVAQRVQIVVFTCRPRDYLLESEIRSPRYDGTGIVAIDLECVVQRSEPDGVAAGAGEPSGRPDVQSRRDAPTQTRQVPSMDLGGASAGTVGKEGKHSRSPSEASSSSSAPPTTTSAAAQTTTPATEAPHNEDAKDDLMAQLAAMLGQDPSESK